jgi:Tol biopolymer transport system component
VPISGEVMGEAAVARMTLPNVRAVLPRVGRNAVWYVSSDSGVDALWRLENGSAAEVSKLGDNGAPLAPALSADGGSIAYVTRRDGQTRLNVMGSDGSNVRVLAESLDVRDAPTWSPDGEWIAVSTNTHLVKVQVSGGNVVPLVEGSARIPIWSPDGRYILYSESIQGGPGYPVKAVTPEGAPFPLPSFGVRRSWDRYRVMPNGREVVFVVGDYGRQDFWLIDIVNGARRRLTSLQPGSSIQGFDISTDGTSILFDRVRENADVVLIDLPRPGS